MLVFLHRLNIDLLRAAVWRVDAGIYGGSLICYEPSRSLKWRVFGPPVASARRIDVRAAKLDRETAHRDKINRRLYEDCFEHFE